MAKRKLEKKTKVILGLTITFGVVLTTAISTPFIIDYVKTKRLEREKEFFPEIQKESTKEKILDIYLQIQNYVEINNVSFGERKLNTDISKHLAVIWSKIEKIKITEKLSFGEVFEYPKMIDNKLEPEKLVELIFKLKDGMILEKDAVLKEDKNEIPLILFDKKENTLIFKKINCRFEEPSVE